MMKRKYLLFTVIILIFFFKDAFSSSFKVYPIKVFFDKKRPTATINVKNEGTEELTLQLSLFSWRQDLQGNDIYEPTKDLVIFPKILTLKGGEERIIRLGTKLSPGEVEQSYRLFIEELPITIKGPPGGEVKAEIKMLLIVSVPVFVRPEKEKKGGIIKELRLQDGLIKAEVKNTGNTHLSLNSVKVFGYGGDGKEVFQHEFKDRYLLQGSSRIYTVKPPTEVCLKLRNIGLYINTDEGITLREKLSLTEDGCKR